MASVAASLSSREVTSDGKYDRRPNENGRWIWTQVLMGYLEVCLESVDDSLGIRELEETIRIERIRKPRAAR